MTLHFPIVASRKTEAEHDGISPMLRRWVISSALWLGLMRLWMMNCSESPFLIPQSEDFFYAYWLGRGLVPLFIVVCLKGLPLTQKALRRTVVPSAILAGLLGALVCFPWPSNQEAYRIACSFIAFGAIGWIYVCWHELYASARIHDVALSVMLSLIFSSIGAFAFVLLPKFWQVAFMLVVPAVCAWATLHFLGQPSSARERAVPFSLYRREETLSQTGSWFFMLAIYFVVVGFVNQLSLSRPVLFSSSFSFLVFSIASVVLAAAFVVFALGKHRLLSTKAFWAILIASIGLSFVLLIAYPDAALVVISVFSSVKYVAVGYINIKLIDISHHVRIPLYVLFAIGWGIIELCSALGTGFGQFTVGYLGLDLDLIFASILALLAMCLLLLSNNSRLCDFSIKSGSLSQDPPSRRLEADGEVLSRRQGRDVVARDAKSDMLQEQCRKLADRHGLTEREVEVVYLVAQGYTQSYAAQSLLVSLNTIRSHMKHIYAKLDIHSKNELLEALNAMQEGFSGIDFDDEEIRS